MYIAYTHTCKGPNYRLRQSFTLNGELTFREIFDLGEDPSVFIKYYGTNAFYFDEILEEAITGQGISIDDDQLEDLLWPWVKWDVRQAVETFRSRTSRTGIIRLDNAQKKRLEAALHPFDKRRAHFLKYGTLDQGPLDKMPIALFKGLLDNCRDETEQYFLKQEFALKAHELKSYVYTVFDLQRFFQSFMARQMPHVLDQDKVDEFFLKEFCRVNQELFKLSSHPHPYMTRYMIMFFDHLYADTFLLDDFAREFMNRHRFYAPPKPKNPVSYQSALSLFNITEKTVSTMTKKGLTRIYHKLARSVHPDTGGSDKEFVKLNDAFHTLLEKIRHK